MNCSNGGSIQCIVAEVGKQKMGAGPILTYRWKFKISGRGKTQNFQIVYHFCATNNNTETTKPHTTISHLLGRKVLDGVEEVSLALQKMIIMIKYKLLTSALLGWCLVILYWKCKCTTVKESSITIATLAYTFSFTIFGLLLILPLTSRTSLHSRQLNCQNEEVGLWSSEALEMDGSTILVPLCMLKKSLQLGDFGWSRWRNSTAIFY